MDIKKQLINQSKKAVGEIIKILSIEPTQTRVDDKTKLETRVLHGKKDLQVKKQAFVRAKKIISGVLEMDYRQQDWARTVIDSLITAGTESVEHLIASLDAPIKVDKISDNGNNVLQAMESKSVAFEDAMEIYEHIDELRKVVSEDEIVLKEVDYNQGYAEIYADKFAKKGSKAKYAPGIDAVIIDPEGTVGDIITISDLRIALPKKPKRLNIANNNRVKAEQYWRRIDPPKALNERSSKGFEDFIEEEFNHKRNGYWFLNNGTAEYISGAHWFHMSRCRTGADGGFYYFTKAQQKLFIFMEAVWCDQRSAGLILEKIRRLGATDMFMSFSLCKSTFERDKIFGMTSKKDSDASKNFRRQTYMFANLPFYFKPICINETAASKLDFRSPSQMLSKNNKSKDRVDNSLNTYCNYESTSEDSYDGDATRLYLGDEFSKWKKQNGNTISHFEMVRKSATKGARITGKIFLFSTVENVTGKDAEDELALAGDRYKKIYYDSDVNDRNENGQTKSYLYKIFISVYEHYEGYIDRYGYAILEDPLKPTKTMDGEIVDIGIKTHIQRELDHLGNNIRARVEYLRKTPIEEADGFAVSEGMCMFNQGNIITQVAYNNLLPKNKLGLNSKLRRGNFRWQKGVRDCGVVEWRDDPNGRFLISWMPPVELRNNVIRRGNILMPGNSDVGAFGIDPYRTDKSKDGSKGSMHGFTKENVKAPSNFFFLEYIHRPEEKKIFTEDVIMAMVFFGMPALIENNVRNLVEALRERGYRKFSLNRPDKLPDKLTEDEKKYGGIPSTSENVIQMQTSAIESYVEHHVGEKDDDTYGDMMFNDTLLDWLSYDSKNRTKRDASISSSLALMACNIKTRRPAANNEVKKEAVQSLFKRFDNTGKVGTRLN